MGSFNMTNLQEKEYDRGAGDYTQGLPPQETGSFYITGYNAAEKANKELTFNYLNYP